MNLSSAFRFLGVGTGLLFLSGCTREPQVSVGSAAKSITAVSAPLPIKHANKKSVLEALTHYSFKTLADPVKAAFQEVNCVFIEDIHTLDDSYKLLADKEFMDALSESNVKDIYLEFLTPEMAFYMNAYSQNKISRHALESLLMHPFDPAGAGMQVHDFRYKAITATLPAIAECARERGMRFHHLNIMNGAVSDAELKAFIDITPLRGPFILKALQDWENKEKASGNYQYSVKFIENSNEIL